MPVSRPPFLFSFIVWQPNSPVFYIYYANRVCWVAFEFDGRLPTWRMCTVTVFAAASQNAENHLTSYSLMHYITGAIIPKMFKLLPTSFLELIALRVFAKNYREVFDEWEFESLPMGARDVKIAANHLPTNLCWKHPNILTDPLPLSQFLHLLPTPLWIMGPLSAFPDRFCLFQSGSDFWDSWPILWITEPSTGPHSYIAVSPFCGLGVPNENKRFVRAMVVLTPWHWQVTCTSTHSLLWTQVLSFKTKLCWKI